MKKALLLISIVSATLALAPSAAMAADPPGKAELDAAALKIADAATAKAKAEAAAAKAVADALKAAKVNPTTPTTLTGTQALDGSSEYKAGLVKLAAGLAAAEAAKNLKLP